MSVSAEPKIGPPRAVNFAWFRGAQLLEPITRTAHASFIWRRDNRPVVSREALQAWSRSAELGEWLRQPRPHLVGALTDAGDCRDWYKHGSNPRFDGLPWRINEPMVASEWVEWQKYLDNLPQGEGEENPDVLLADWTAKYGKQKNEGEDPNYGRQTPIFIKPKPQRAQDVPNPNQMPSLITIIDAGRKTGRTFEKPAGLSNWTIGLIPAGEPEYVTPNLECFSEPPRPREDVGWNVVDGHDALHARRIPEIPGGDGGGAAKTQIKEEDFTPAELPSPSLWRAFEDRFNKGVDNYKREREVFRFDHPNDFYNWCDGQPIVRQDRHGNLAGQHFNMVRITLVSRPKRQQELDRQVEEARRRRIDATLTKEDELVLTTCFGKPAAVAAGELNISEAAMRKRVQRFGRDGEVTKEMIGVAVHETYPKAGEPGFRSILDEIREEGRY